MRLARLGFRAVRRSGIRAVRVICTRLVDIESAYRPQSRSKVVTSRIPYSMSFRTAVFGCAESHKLWAYELPHRREIVPGAVF